MDAAKLALILTADPKAANKALADVEAGAQRASKAVEAMGARGRDASGRFAAGAKEAAGAASGVGTAAAGAGRSISSMFDGITARVGQASAGLLAIGAGFAGLAARAAQAESVQKSFNMSMEKMGRDGATELQKLKDASLGMVSAQELMKKTTMGSMLIGTEAFSQFGSNAEVMAKMLNIAQASARATGQDVNFMFDSIVRGVARSSPMILDNLGLAVKLGPAYEEWGAKIGKAADELTGAEQKAAILNQVLRQGQGFIETYGISSGGVRTQAQQFGVVLEEVALKVGATFLPVMSKLYEVGLLALGAIDRLTPALSALFSVVGKIPTPLFAAGMAFAGLAGGASALTALLGPLSMILGPVMGGALATVSATLASLAVPVALLVGGLAMLATNAFGARDALAGMLAPFQPQIDAALAGIDALQKALTSAMSAFNGAEAVDMGWVGSLTVGLQTLANQMATTQAGPFFQALASAAGMAGPALDRVGAALQTGVASGLLELANAMVAWHSNALPGWIASLRTLGLEFIAWATGDMLPTLASTGATFAASLTGWVGQAVPMLVASLATWGDTIISNVANVEPRVVETILAWADSLVSWVYEGVRGISAAWPMLRDAVLDRIGETATNIVNKAAEWAHAFVSWIPSAIERLATGTGQIIGSVVRFLVTSVPRLYAAVLGWAAMFSEFAIYAIPRALQALSDILGRMRNWILTEGVPLLVSAATKLATGLVRGFLDALQGKSGELKMAGGGAAKSMTDGWTRSGWWEAGKRNAAAKIEEVAAAQERQLLKEDKRLAKAAGNVGKTVAEGMAGGGAGAGGGKAKAEPKGGAGGAGEDPASKAMALISGTSQALTSLLDFAEKAFNFRGFPPPSIMDKLFGGLRDIIQRAVQLSKGMKAETVELATSVGSLASGWVSALTGLLELADKMARFRVPSESAKAQLYAMAAWLLGAAQALTAMFAGKLGLERALAKAAVSTKVAEALKAWAEFIKLLAEAAGALARARLDVDLGPVMAFVQSLARSVLAISGALQAQLGDQMGMVLANARAVSDTLRPWVDLIKAIAETTGAMARARWPGDLTAPEAFIGSLADMAMRVTGILQARLGPTILVALEDSRIVADTLKAWIEPLSKMKDVTGSLARMRVVDTGAAEGLLLSVLEMGQRFVALVRARLGPMLLVGLEDSRTIAETLGAWLGPLERVGAAAQSIDVLRGVTQRRTGDALAGLLAWTLDLANGMGQFVERARGVLGPAILVALETSREVAGTLGAWLDPLSKVGAVADAIDRMQGYARSRAGRAFDGVGAFVLDLANSMAVVVDSSTRALGAAQLVAWETSAEVGKTFAPWLDMLARVGAASDSIDRVTAFAQTRMDTGLGAVFDLLVEAGNRGWQVVQAVQRWPNPSEFLGVSQTVAQTFGAWVDMLSKVGGAVDSIRKVGRLQGGEMAGTEAFLLDIARRFGGVVQAIATWPDPAALQGLSQTVAATWGAWLDMLSKVGAAAHSIDSMDPPDVSALTRAADWLMEVGRTFWPFVQDLNRRADPKAVQQVSAQVAATWGAWIDMLSKAAGLSEKLNGLEPVQPGQWDILAGAVAEAMRRAMDLSADVRGLTDLAREALVTGMGDFVRVALSAVDLFDKAAGLGAKLASSIAPTPDAFSAVGAIIQRTFEAVRLMAANAMPRLRAEASRLQASVEGYVKMAEGAVALFDKAAGLGARLRAATEPLLDHYMLVARVISQAVGYASSMAADLMPKLQDEQKRFNETTSAYVKLAGDSVGLFDKAAGLGATIRRAVEPVLGDYIRVAGVIDKVVRHLSSLAADIMPKANTAAAAWVAGLAQFNSVAGPALDLVLKAADIGAKLSDAVELNATRLGYVADGIVRVLAAVQAGGREWVAAQTNLSQSVSDIQGFAQAAQAALGLVKPAVDALVALAAPNLLPAGEKALELVSSTVSRITTLIEDLSKGYRTATGELDVLRTGAITGFAQAAQAALGPVKDVIDVLLRLHDSQGKLGGLTSSIRGQIDTGIRSLVDLMRGMAKDYDAGTAEGRMVSESVAKFAASVGSIIRPISDAVRVLDDVWKFAYAVDPRNAGRMVRVIRNFGKVVMDDLRDGMKALIGAVHGVYVSLGPELLLEAEAASKSIAPVAAAVSAMLDPMVKLMESPFVDSRGRSSKVLAGAAQTRIVQLGRNVASGVRMMAEALVNGLTGIVVPEGIETPIMRLLGVVDSLLTAIERAMTMPKIDFGKLDDLWRAGSILAGIGAMFGAGGGAQGPGGPSGGGAGGGAQGPGGPSGGGASRVSADPIWQSIIANPNRRSWGGVPTPDPQAIAASASAGLDVWVQRGSVPPDPNLFANAVGAQLNAWVQRGSVPPDPNLLANAIGAQIDAWVQRGSVPPPPGSQSGDVWVQRGKYGDSAGGGEPVIDPNLLANSIGAGLNVWVQRGSVPPLVPFITAVADATQAGLDVWVQRGSVPPPPGSQSGDVWVQRGKYGDSEGGAAPQDITVVVENQFGSEVISRFISIVRAQAATQTALAPVGS